MHPYFILINKVVLCFSILALGACRESETREPATVDTWIQTAVGDQPILIQAAFTESERQKGLMYRREMDKDAGMLFVFETPQARGFWMKNTYIPLDIAYMTSDGVIREIYPMYPLNENSVRSVRADISIALEMNQGWFAENGVELGDALMLEPVIDLIERRGLSPSGFSINP
ncbi:MAG: DUF192 domain-containing protein [Opitutales bacterium]|nr:DUF192 domain-containing protein [Opitutales bacterium]NRA26800.1 DUF192 domain-containing protein [Opitutales bacterium]